MSNVKQNVIRIVMGLPPVEPEVVVAVPAEMTVEQAHAALMEHAEKVGEPGFFHPEHPEPSEDPTGFSGEQDEDCGENLKGGCMADFDEDGTVTKDFFSDGNHDQWKPFIKFRVLGGTNYIVPRETTNFVDAIDSLRDRGLSQFPRIALCQILVRYYLEGWRTGYLVSDNGFTSVITPITAKGAAKPRNVKVPSDDVKLV